MRLLDIAHKLSYSGRHSNKKFRMAAVVAKGGAILSVGVNARENHAEQRALKPHRCFNGATIYIARTTGGISKPCPDCLDKIKLAGVSMIVYRDSDRQIVKEKI